jgi:iron complex outermembrane receptor protein
MSSFRRTVVVALASGFLAPSKAQELNESAETLPSTVVESTLPRPASRPAPAPRPAPAAPPVIIDDAAPVAEAIRVSESGYASDLQSAVGFLEQSVLDTPFQVTVLPSELIRDQQARSLTEIARNDPSVMAGGNSPGFYDRVAIRGFYVFNAHRDGLAINDQAQMPLENKAAVEIVKGLAALRYGFISPGGVVNYVTKRPTEDTLARINNYGSTFGTIGVHGDFGGRLGPDGIFGYRINTVFEEEHTYVDGVNGPRRMVSGAFDFRPNDRLLVEFEFEHQYRELPEQPGLYNGIFAPGVNELAMIERFDPSTFLGANWGTYPTWTTFFGGRIRYELNDEWAVRLAVARQDLTRDQIGVYPAFGSIRANGDYDVEQYYFPDQERDVTVVQAVLEGDLEVGSFRHQLVAGYIFEDRVATAPDGFNGVIGSSNLFNPVPVANPYSSSPPSYVYGQETNHSFFVADTWEVSEHIDLFGGVRYIVPQFDSFDATGALTNRFDESVLTPSAGIVLKPVEEVSYYFSYAEALEQGGTAPVTAANRLEQMPPLDSRQYELGMKAEVGNRAIFSAALFHIDKGLEYLDPDSNLYTQDGRQVHQGIEATLAGEISDGLRLIGGFAMLDATVEESGDPLLNGKRPQGVPEWQANLFLDRSLDGLIEGLSVNTGLYFSDDKPISPDNTLAVDGYVRWDVGLRYRTLLFDRATTFRANLLNVTDEHYIENASFGSYGFGAPRSLNLAMEIEF